MIEMCRRTWRGVEFTAWGGGGGVLLALAAVLGTEAVVQSPLDYEAGISGPQSGKRLANQKYGVLERTGLYLTDAWSDVPCTVMPCKGIEDRDQVPV